MFHLNFIYQVPSVIGSFSESFSSTELAHACQEAETEAQKVLLEAPNTHNTNKKRVTSFIVRKLKLTYS